MGREATDSGGNSSRWQTRWRRHWFSRLNSRGLLALAIVQCHVFGHQKCTMCVIAYAHAQPFTFSFEAGCKSSACDPRGYFVDVGPGVFVEFEFGEQLVNCKLEKMSIRALTALSRLPTALHACSTARSLAARALSRPYSTPNDLACRLDSTVTDRYMRLPTGDKVLATYVWIDGTGQVIIYFLFFLFQFVSSTL